MNDMSKDQAIQLLELLVERSMAKGHIADFKTLDALRNAVAVLKNGIAVPKQNIGSGANEINGMVGKAFSKEILETVGG